MRDEAKRQINNMVFVMLGMILAVVEKWYLEILVAIIIGLSTVMDSGRWKRIGETK